MVTSAGLLRGIKIILMPTTQILILRTGSHMQHVLPVVLQKASKQSAAQAMATNLQSEASALRNPTPSRQSHSWINGVYKATFH